MNAPRKILVVDENRIVRDWVRGALKPDLEVVELASAALLENAVREERPALVLLDAALPSSEGARLIAGARRGAPDGQVCLLLFSPSSAEQLAAQSAAWGADGFVRKSGDAGSFRQRVDDYLAAAQGSIAPSEGPAHAQGRAAASVIIAGGGPWSRVVIGWLKGRFNIVHYATAQEVRAALREQRPSLLVFAEDLIGAGPEELCRELRSDAKMKQISLIFVGRPGDHLRAREVREAGANLVLLRPLEESSFFAAVNSLGHVAVRRSSRLLIRIEVQLSSGLAFYVGFTSNLSSTGLLIESDYDAEPEAEIGLRFFLPGHSDEVVAQARVVRVRGRAGQRVTFGARFLALADTDRLAIESFVGGKR